jgi:hypothetical protein
LMRCSGAPGRTRHLASGLRRHAPTPVQGASISTRSAASRTSPSSSALPRRAHGDDGRARLGNASGRPRACRRAIRAARHEAASQQAFRGSLPEPSGPPAVPRNHPRADFYRGVRLARLDLAGLMLESIATVAKLTRPK